MPFKIGKYAYQNGYADFLRIWLKEFKKEKNVLHA